MNIMYKFRHILASALLIATSTLPAQENMILSSIRKEVDRNKAELKIDKLQSPFYIRYIIYEDHTLDVNASLGALSNSSEYTRRLGNPTLLVGNYQQNNSRYLTPSIYYGWNSYPSQITIENDPQGIATSIWMDLDKKYKSAAEAYEAKQAIIRHQNLNKEELELADFEQIEPVQLQVTPQKMNMDKAYWENFAKKASALLIKYPQINSSSVDITVGERTLYYYDTENTQYMLPVPYYKIKLGLQTMTDDGQELSDDLYFEHPTFEQMPDLDTFITQCEDFISYFIQLKNAPIIDESYNGPVLFEKMALAEAFYYKFFTPGLIAKGKSIASKEMERYDGNAAEGNNQEMMTNKKIISRSLSIKSLTGSQTYNGMKLDGSYPVDAEGAVPGKELILVENGVLRNMLNGSTPTLKNKHTNGHARYNVQRQTTSVTPGNLQLISDETYSPEELKQKLLSAAKEEDLDYAYIIRRLRGYSPLAVYRVYLKDGREELVRGVNLPDFTMRSFKRVLGATRTNYLYNTYFGGLITYIVPEGLLLEELEVTRDNNLLLKTPYIVPQPEITPEKATKKKKK